MGRIFGIRIFLHFTTPLVILLLAFLAARGEEDFLHSTAWFAGMMAAVFLCILLHELGHSVVSIAFGYPVADITLLPIGGVARMMDLPTHPGKELAIAIAGPMVNFLIAAGIGVVQVVRLAATGTDPVAALSRADAQGLGFLAQLLVVNVGLGLFNLAIPAFPMDGGRILRALLALFLPHVTATRIATLVGQVLGVLMVAGAILRVPFVSPMMGLIGAFIFVLAAAERRAAVARARREEMWSRAAAVPFRETVGLGEPVSSLVGIPGAALRFFSVRDGEGRLVGLLSSRRLGGPTGTAADGGADDAANLPPAASILSPDAPLWELFRRAQAGGGPAGLVVDNDRVIGIVMVEGVQ